MANKLPIWSISKYTGGVDSGRSPLDLPEDVLAFGLNISVRGGYIHPRPPFMLRPLDFGGDADLQEAVERGFFQGATRKPYKPDFGQAYHVAQISGRQFKFEEINGIWTVTEITIPGDPNDATTGQVWMWQAEKWLIITDGSAKLPLFWDNTIMRRSFGPAQVYGTTSVNFAPPNPRVIGEIITVTLAAPYTGPFDVPVLFNGAFYQPIANPGGGYGISLKELYDSAASIPAGTDIVVSPSIIGVQLNTVVRPDAGTTYAAGNTGIILTFTRPTYITAGTKMTFLGQTWNAPFNSVSMASTTIFVQNTTTFTWPATLPAGTKIYKASGISPDVILGQLFSAFTPPGIGATANATMTTPYTGTAGQVVYIGATGQYEITAIPPAPPGLTLSMINLTDTSIAVITAPSSILSVPELPAGRMGAYGQYHVAMSLVDGISFIYGDTVGGPSGTPANNYRDAVLKTSESDLLIGQGAFRIPSSGELITSMTFTANLDASLGQGPLQIGTSISMFSCLVTNVRSEWASLNGPILPASLIGKGPLAQNSTALANSDTIFRSYDGLGSLILARRDFQDSWGNTPISREMERILSRDNPTLLSYGSQANFDNRRLDTASPQVSSQGVFHVGYVAINFDPVSNLRGKAPSVWDSTWTGINILQWNAGTIGVVERCLPFTFNFTDQKIELYELLKEGTTEYLDNGVTPIVTVFETGVIFHPDKRPKEIPLVKLTNGKIYLQKMKGNINVKVYWRPLFWPCWELWHQRDICVQTTGSEIKPGYMTIGLGQPPITPCDPSSKVPLVIGRGHQLRCEITGQYEFMGGDFQADEQPEVVFPPPICELKDCRIIQCTVPDDLRIYSIQGLPPLPPLPIDLNLVGNGPVYYSFPCEGGEITYDGTLPSWITIDVANSRLVGAGNTFFANSLVLANQSAQNALNAFALSAIGEGTLNCGGSEPASCDGSNTDQYEISPYADGDVLNTLGSVLAGGEVLFAGTLAKKSDDNSCLWMARNSTDPMFEVTGLQLCNVEIQFATDRWFLTFLDGNTPFPATWQGEKMTGATPAGIYTRTGGSSAVPATLTVINIGGVAPDEFKENCSSS